MFYCFTTARSLAAVLATILLVWLWLPRLQTGSSSSSSIEEAPPCSGGWQLETSSSHPLPKLPLASLGHTADNSFSQSPQARQRRRWWHALGVPSPAGCYYRKRSQRQQRGRLLRSSAASGKAAVLPAALVQARLARQAPGRLNVTWQCGAVGEDVHTYDLAWQRVMQQATADSRGPVRCTHGESYAAVPDSAALPLEYGAAGRHGIGTKQHDWLSPFDCDPDLQAASAPRARIAVVTACIPGAYAPARMGYLTGDDNKLGYAALHGYAFIELKHRTLLPGLDPRWEKVAMVSKKQQQQQQQHVLLLLSLRHALAAAAVPARV